LQLDAQFPKKSEEALSFSWTASAMLSGVRSLASTDPIPNLALALLCGHGIECALKALLAQSGLNSEELRRKPYGHDLLELWKATLSKGFQIESPPPLFLECLNQVYDAPFKLRYPNGSKGITLPTCEVMKAGLEDLTKIVFLEVKEFTPWPES
jgi:hypothetical protein